MPRSGAAPLHDERALVLRRFPYGESSLVVQVLTRGAGRVSLVAKGAYRPRSGYFGVLDYFDSLRVRWRGRPASGLRVLSGAEIDVRRRGLTRDLARYRAGLSVLELAGLGAREGDGDPRLFDWAEGALEAIAREEGPLELLRISFDLRFLQTMGLAPALDACAACGRRMPDGVREGRVAFSVGAGGTLCRACADEARAAGRSVETVPLNWIRIARSLRDAPPERIARIHLDTERTTRVRDLIQRFLDYHLETRPRSRRTRSHGRPSRPSVLRSR